MARITAVANLKGGVGKTTTVVNLGTGISMETGQRVLLVDMDPQANLTEATIGELPEGTPGMYEAMDKPKEYPVKSLIRKLEHVDLLPTTIKLVDAESDFMDALARETILERVLDPVIKDYDYVLIDCPASLGLISLNIFACCTDVLVPVVCGSFAFGGLIKMEERLEEIRDARINENVHICGVVGTMHQSGQNLAKQLALALEEDFGDLVLKTYIRRNVRVDEAPTHMKSVLEYSPRSAGAQDYRKLTKEFLGLEQ